MNLKTYTYVIFIALSIFPFTSPKAQENAAHELNEILLEGIRNDFARPTVHARNLFHASIGMYDAWAAYDEEAKPYLLGNTVGNYTCNFDKASLPIPVDIEAARDEAISFAVYRLLIKRFQNSPGRDATYALLDDYMLRKGYDRFHVGQDASTGNPASLGNYIGACLINMGNQDNANENSDYENQYYEPYNDPLIMAFSGNPDIQDPNRWQPLTLNVFIDQSGNVIPFNTPPFLSPEWGKVTPFSLTTEDLTIFKKTEGEYWVYNDPGAPPLLDTTAITTESEEYKWGFSLVSVWGSHLDPMDGVEIDISPGAQGNTQSYPTDWAGLREFYNRQFGGDPSTGRDLNPATGQPYEPNIVKRGDYARVLAEFWADGPDSETPPGHWFTLLNYVSEHPDFIKQFNGQDEVLSDLEWYVKAYFTLGGAMHDSAVTTWGIKGHYDYVRPVSAIRAMAEYGQSSDPNLPNYHVAGFQLEPGYIEMVGPNDPLVGVNNEHLNKIKLYTWRGPDYISDPATTTAGVGWILAEDWWPFQRPSFVSPNFAGYVSGHSTFSRAAAEVLTDLTGDEFFPGGMGTFDVEQNEFLVFEDGPSESFTLQWATYADASDQTSLSRIWGGIHPPADDIPGRLIGMKIGNEVFDLARSYFYSDDDNDGFFSYEDCNDNEASVYPGAVEICDDLDNDCNGETDENLALSTYYFDNDGDGFGDAAQSIDVCFSTPPSQYVRNGNDCDDNNINVNPAMAEICDDIDNDCSGMINDGIESFTYYLDADNDGFGDANNFIDTCDANIPMGYVTNGDDCNDYTDQINPLSAEVCDNFDNDCNNLIDDGIMYYSFFKDADGDGFGNPNDSVSICRDLTPDTYVNNNGDCDDTNPNINPEAEDIPSNGIDEDCDGMDLVTSTLQIASSKLNIYPNPTEAHITIDGPLNSSAEAILIGVNGKEHIKSIINFNNNKSYLDLNELPKGVYFLRILPEGADKYLSTKVVKM
jgi:hypothetical protein